MVSERSRPEPKTTSEDWTEKYRPEKLSQVIGNDDATSKLKSWASAWVDGKPTQKAVVLAGKPGIGKTTSALALANEMGWEVLEMNASDHRNREAIKDFVGRSAVDDTFSVTGDFVPYKEGKRTLLILDEADNIFGREDKGGIDEIVKTIRRTEQPIILIANDYYDLTRRSQKLKNLCKKIDFEPVKKSTIVALLKRICENERIEYDMGALRAIAERAEGDVRSAIRDLESLSLGSSGTLTLKEVDALGNRNREADIFPTLKEILQNKDPIKAKESINDLDEEPSNLIVWIDENLPREYEDPDELFEGYFWLSKADVYLGRVRRRQWYRAWVYANEAMTAGVCSAKKHEHRGWTKYAFPSWIRKMSDSKRERNIKNSISSKIAPKIHSTSGKVNSRFLTYLKSLSKRDIDIKKALVEECGLTQGEIAYILNSRKDSKKVKYLFAGKEEKREETYEGERSVGEDDEKEEEKEKEEDEQQRSLLEF